MKKLILAALMVVLMLMSGVVKADDKKLDDPVYVARSFVTAIFVASSASSTLYDAAMKVYVLKDFVPAVEESIKVIRKNDESGVFSKKVPNSIPAVEIKSTQIEEGVTLHLILVGLVYEDDAKFFFVHVAKFKDPNLCYVVLFTS